MADTTVSFRVSTKLTRLLGEESVSRATVAISELVKNSYDADATNCRVAFEGSMDNLVLRIIDDGAGMTVNDIVDKWMVVGTSDKEHFPTTDGGRVKVGAKGIGRFAVQRIGRAVEVISRPKGDDDVIRLYIDWDLYNDASKTLNEITHQITTAKRGPSESHGLELVISRLRDNWTGPLLEDLEQTLSTIVPSAWDEKQFAITFSAPALGVIRRELQSAIFSEYLYRLDMEFDGESTATYELDFRRTPRQKGKTRTAKGKIDVGSLGCGPVHFELFCFVLAPGRKKRYAPWVLKGDQMKKQLASSAGIRIFRDNFRVRPYGDPGNDWMELNVMARNELYAFPNDSVVGSVQISRMKNPIMDTTTREGLIQNQAFIDLKSLIKKSVQLVIATRRKDFPEEAKVTAESESFARLVSVARRIETQANDPTLVKTFNEVLQTVQQDVAMQEVENMNRISMYRGLASLGISLSAVAHEVAEPIASIFQRAVWALSTMDRRPFSLDESLRSWRQVKKDATQVGEFVDYVSVFTSAQERQKSAIHLGELIKDVLRGYDSILRQELIELDVRISAEMPPVNGYRVDFESVMINLITNAIEAFREVHRGKRLMRISARKQDPLIWIKFSDNGPGIPPENREIIFEPFWTSKSKEGTGLGLTICREILNEYGGAISVENSELENGATFLITVPIGLGAPK